MHAGIRAKWGIKWCLIVLQVSVYTVSWLGTRKVGHFWFLVLKHRFMLWYNSDLCYSPLPPPNQQSQHWSTYLINCMAQKSKTLWTFVTPIKCKINFKNLKQNERMLDSPCGEMTCLLLHKNRKLKITYLTWAQEVKAQTTELSLPSPEETGHSMVYPKIRRVSARRATGCVSTH